MMYPLIRFLLFMLPPERAHAFTFTCLRLIQAVSLWPRKRIHPSLARQVAGLEFPHPVGLAAGLDKDAVAFRALGMMGFSFVEVGTVTPLPQPGNPGPRLFRLKKDKALINRMGFNNKGAAAMAKKLAGRNGNEIIGVNIGKNKWTPNEQAKDDYLKCFKLLAPLADYIVINVSSPNTPGLRALQDKAPLKEILAIIMAENEKMTEAKPIFLKIAPDLNRAQLDDVIELVKETRISGIVATNTTLSREGLSASKQDIDSIGTGGLSGRPLGERATEVIRYIRQKGGSQMAIIGVGGIHSPKNALEKLDAGADLIQLYTGFIYKGPRLINAINKRLLSRS